jgi:hypothetical protein
MPTDYSLFYMKCMPIELVGTLKISHANSMSLATIQNLLAMHIWAMASSNQVIIIVDILICLD